MHFAFGVFAGVFLQVHRRIALLQTGRFVVVRFIARYRLVAYHNALRSIE